jgi:NADH:ubiquinone oxidoreductase subunit K
MDFVILSMAMLAVGIYGLLTKRQLLKIFISIELVATAATLNFIMLSSTLSKDIGQVMMILAFSTDTNTPLSSITVSLKKIRHKRY